MSSTCDKYSAELLAYLDGALEAGEAEAVRLHCTECGPCSEELAWMKAACISLEHAGDKMVADLPPINVVAGVMTAVAQEAEREVEASRRISFAAARSKAPRGRFWLGFATAAALLLSVWVSYEYLAKHPTAVRMTAHPGTNTAKSPTAASNAAATKQHKQEFDEERSQLNAMRPRPQSENDTAFVPTAPPEVTLKTTAQDVIQVRRKAQTLPDALAQLNQWARLSVEEARTLAASPNASLAEEVTASESLPLDEAISVLEKAVTQNPDDLTARFALAKAYGERGGMETQALTAWADLAQKDPQNSTPYMEMASLYFQQGDPQSAMAMLQRAATLPRADVYTSTSAQYRETTLTAAGVSPDAAALLSAFTAGSNEYNYLYNLGSNLLAQGQFYEQNGDPTTALQLYQSVLQFGDQVAQSADYSTTQLAGLDLQRAATDVLETAYANYGTQQDMQALADHSTELVASIDQLSTFMTSLNQLFSSNLDTVMWGIIADLVINNGDLSLFDFLKDYLP